MSFSDPRVVGGLGVSAAPALDRAGVETVSGPEPYRALAGRVLLLAVVAGELLALRSFLPPRWSYGFLDGLLISTIIACGILILSGVPGFRWLENRRARPSMERTVRYSMYFAAIQVFVVSSLILRDLPGLGWILGGVVVYVVCALALPPWIVDRGVPAMRRALGMRRAS